jgi:hypothetical protein
MQSSVSTLPIEGRPRATAAEINGWLSPYQETLGSYPLVVVGLRGYFAAMGASSGNDRNIYDDGIVLWVPSLNVCQAFNGNTDASRIRAGFGTSETSRGMAMLKPGVWPVYRFAMHNGSHPHEALCQRAGEVTVIRDGTPPYPHTGEFGINIHKGGFNTTSSLGCQTIPPAQWEEFYSTAKNAAIKLWADEWREKTVAYVLLDMAGFAHQYTSDTNDSDISWFKATFGSIINSAVKDTPFTIDMLVAIALQETGYIWSKLRKQQLSSEEISALCVGDTLDDTGGRKAFPLNKHELLQLPDGERMFAIARQGLEEMAAATKIKAYLNVVTNPNKFCHGFGVFQYDLQFFKDNPYYFLNKEYCIFVRSLEKCLEELKHALRRVKLKVKLGDEQHLTDEEMAYVAIAYNTGSFKPEKGLKQGYFNGKQYYGEEFFKYLKMSQNENP